MMTQEEVDQTVDELFKDLYDEGGRVFPISSRMLHYGMSMRDYFAAMAISGTAGAAAGQWNSQYVEVLATAAYAIADAMVDERLV